MKTASKLARAQGSTLINHGKIQTWMVKSLLEQWIKTKF